MGAERTADAPVQVLAAIQQENMKYEKYVAPKMSKA
jgi:hypothetical protein